MTRAAGEHVRDRDAHWGCALKRDDHRASTRKRVERIVGATRSHRDRRDHDLWNPRRVGRDRGPRCAGRTALPPPPPPAPPSSPVGASLLPLRHRHICRRPRHRRHRCRRVSQNSSPGHRLPRPGSRRQFHPTRPCRPWSPSPGPPCGDDVGRVSGLAARAAGTGVCAASAATATTGAHHWRRQEAEERAQRTGSDGRRSATRSAPAGRRADEAAAVGPAATEGPRRRTPAGCPRAVRPREADIHIEDFAGPDGQRRSHGRTVAADDRRWRRNPRAPRSRARDRPRTNRHVVLLLATAKGEHRRPGTGRRQKCQPHPRCERRWSRGVSVRECALHASSIGPTRDPVKSRIGLAAVS